MGVGIDIGGTFTDLVSCESGTLLAVKVPSTPSDYSEGFSEALDSARSDDAKIESIVHATTIATNALIQRKGARIGLITTEGFKDVLSLRRRDRRQSYGIETAFAPLIPREMRREVRERSSPSEVLKAVEPDDVLTVADGLFKDGAQAILVAFLHSVTCPENERIALSALRARFPGRFVFASHQISDEPTEFERFSTGAASAYVAPLVSEYIDGIVDSTMATQDLQIVTSDGGLVDVQTAKSNPVRTALSGPAAGVWGARAVCDRIGRPAFVACDMGGTSFDVCLVREGTPPLTRSRELDFGMPIAVEMLDIATIGAGGGSIVSVSSVGKVEVGPEGVGADPGPACYGKQGHCATVADADLVLGRISSTLRLPSGSRSLDVDAARKTIRERVAAPVGVSVEEAAGLIVAPVEERMADQIRQMALHKRVDVTSHLLFAYGGAGPVHAAGISAALGIDEIAIPPNAGLFSAWGGLLTSERTSVSTSHLFALDSSALSAVEAILADHTEAIATEDAVVSHSVDVLAEGSHRTVTVRLAAEEGVDSLMTRAREGLLEVNDRLAVTRVLSVATRSPRRDLEEVVPRVEVSDYLEPTTRGIFFESQELECAIIDRGSLGAGSQGEGPCVIEEPGATTVCPPGFAWRVGDLSMLFLERKR